MRTTATTSTVRRGMVLLLAVLVGTVTHAVAFTVAARAALPDHLGTGDFTAFEIDGDIAGANDWEAGGYGPYTTAQGRASTGTVAISPLGQSDACESPGDDFYTGSIAGVPFPWPSGTGNVNRKNDICEFGSALEIVDVDGEYHYVVYGYAARPGDATGDVSLLFVLDKPNTEVGDVIIEFDYNPSSAVASFRQATWDGASWVVSALADGAQGAVGPNPFPSGGAEPGDQTFAEFAIDLTSNDILPPADPVTGAEECGTFTSGGFATYTGNDASSSLGDRAAPSAPTPVSNCTDVQISKAANVDAPGVLFEYDLDRAGGETVHDDTLVPPAGVTDLDGSTAGIAATIEVGQTHLWQNVFAGDDYQLQETLVPDGWDLVDVTCTWYDPFTGTTNTDVVVTDPVDVLQQFQVPPTIADNGVTTSCVITNETSGIVVEKVGAGDPAAEFPIAVSGAAASPYVLALGGSTGIIAYDPGTTVTIAETLPVATPGWVYEGAVCTADAEGFPVEFGPGDPIEVTTVGGQVITCTLTNTQQGQINVVKPGEPADSTDDFGFDTTYSGPLDGTPDFTLQIDDPANSSGELAPGTYTVEELIDATNAAADPDYALGSISCAIATAGAGTSSFTYGGDGTFELGDTDATIDLAAGDVVDCTFVNEQAGRLIVVKQTDGADDTFAFDGAVTGSITTTGGATAAGDELVADVPAGSYDVTETIPAGWDLTGATCDNGSGVFATGEDAGGLTSIVVDAGDIVTCTFTNARETASLSLTKLWSDTATTGDAVDLVASGDDAVAGELSEGLNTVDGSPDDADAVITIHPSESVSLSEVFGAANVGSYDTVLVCDQPGLSYTEGDLEGTYAVPADDPLDVTCTFTNERRSATMVVTKDWVNAADGDEVSLAAQGDSGNETAASGGSVAPDADTDAVLTIWAGETVGIAESFDGFDNVGSYSTELSCTEDGLTYTSGASSGSFAVPADPVDVTCTFVNTRTSAQLTLQKEWVDGADGDTAVIDVAATLASAPADGVTSTADGTLGPVLDTTNVVTAEVLSGEAVTLTEVLGDGNTGSYDSVLSCDAAGLVPEPTTGTTGSYTVPDAPVDVTCTFTNTRTRVTLAVEKEWVDASAGDVATVSFDGAVSAPSPDSTATGAAGSELDTPVVSGEVLSGETVTLTEVLAEANAGTYASSLTCAGGEPIGVTTGEYTVPSDATEPITCRFLNAAGRGNIVVVKNVEGADGTFSFSGDWPDPDTGDTALVGDFTITTEGGTGSQAWAAVVVPAAGTYTVVETDPAPAYDGTDLVCVDPDGESSVDGLTATIDLDAGETVTCTYTNTQRSTITVLKDAVPDDDQTFTFTTSGDPLPATFDLVDDGTDMANSFTSALLPAGATYSVTEGDVAGWSLTSATCDNGNTPDEITPAPGTNVTCTFVNEAAPSSITVTKLVEGVADDLPWSFDLAVDPVDPGVTSPQTVSGVGNSSDAVTFAPLTLNRTYTITEPTLPPGWEQVSVVCADAPDEDLGTPGYQVTITEPDQDVACAITNSASATIVVDKVTDPAGDPTPFDFQIGPLGGEATGFTLTDAGEPAVFAGLAPGDYLLEELVPDGWALTDVTCSPEQFVDASGQATITVGPGDTVTCTYTNSGRGDLTIDKRVTTYVDEGDGAFTVTYELVVSGDSAVEESYTLDDRLRFGDGVIIDGVSASSADGVVAPDWDGVTMLTVTDGAQSLPPGATHIYTVEVSGTVTGESTVTSRDCLLAEGESGTGLLNEATVTYDGGSVTDDACEVPPFEHPPTGLDDGPALVGVAALLVLLGLALLRLGRRRPGAVVEDV
jgi:hypothetical protein